MVDWKKSFQHEGIHWWRSVFGVPHYFKERRYLLKHGFTREAEYDMPLWFIKTMTRVMIRYSDTRWGIPGGYTDEEWQAVVDKMIECLKNMRASVKDAKFVTVWSGDVTITTDCKVDTETNEVFDIECVDVDVDILLNEYIVLDGKERLVFDRDGEYYIL